jgi:hypothetical protein
MNCRQPSRRGLLLALGPCIVGGFAVASATDRTDPDLILRIYWP